MSTLLSYPEIGHALGELPGWHHRDDALVKTFKFGSFREAIAFMVRAAFEAEALDHHPEWTNVYNRVEIRLTTHAAENRVTERDLDLARRIQRVSWVG